MKQAKSKGKEKKDSKNQPLFKKSLKNPKKDEIEDGENDFLIEEEYYSSSLLNNEDIHQIRSTIENLNKKNNTIELGWMSPLMKSSMKKKKDTRSPSTPENILFNQMSISNYQSSPQIHKIEIKEFPIPKEPESRIIQNINSFSKQKQDNSNRENNDLNIRFDKSNSFLKHNNKKEIKFDLNPHFEKENCTNYSFDSKSPQVSILKKAANKQLFDSTNTIKSDSQSLPSKFKNNNTDNVTIDNKDIEKYMEERLKLAEEHLESDLARERNQSMIRLKRMLEMGRKAYFEELNLQINDQWKVERPKVIEKMDKEVRKIFELYFNNSQLSTDIESILPPDFKNTLNQYLIELKNEKINKLNQECQLIAKRLANSHQVSVQSQTTSRDNYDDIVIQIRQFIQENIKSIQNQLFSQSSQTYSLLSNDEEDCLENIFREQKNLRKMLTDQIRALKASK